MNCGKNKKNILEKSSVEFAPRVIKVKRKMRGIENLIYLAYWHNLNPCLIPGILSMIRVLYFTYEPRHSIPAKFTYVQANT